MLLFSFKNCKHNLPQWGRLLCDTENKPRLFSLMFGREEEKNAFKTEHCDEFPSVFTVLALGGKTVFPLPLAFQLFCIFLLLQQLLITHVSESSHKTLLEFHL